MLSEDDILFLYNLKRNDSNKYNRKLRILGIADSDIPFEKVTNLIVSTSRVKSNPEPGRQKLYFMGGKPYFGEPPANFVHSVKKANPIKKVDPVKKADPIIKVYLVDGDNHVNEALPIINKTNKTDSVRVYCTQEGLEKKLNKKYKNRNIKIVHVKSGNQAVDNVIDNQIEKELQNRRQKKKIFIVSHDKGFQVKIEYYKGKYKLKDDDLVLI